MFTRRTESLARHSGQVSFPGGRSEAHDLSPVETALRETFEETGIAPSFVTVAGYLDRYLTGTGFDIQPVVGLLTDGFALTPVTRAKWRRFSRCRWPFFCDPANRRRESREIGGKKRFSTLLPTRITKSGAPPPPRSCDPMVAPRATANIDR